MNRTHRFHQNPALLQQQHRHQHSHQQDQPQQQKGMQQQHMVCSNELQLM
jgi:hypothetical protein